MQPPKFQTWFLLVPSSSSSHPGAWSAVRCKEPKSFPLRASIEYGWLAVMKKPINRRKFVASTAIGAVAGRSLIARAQAPQALTRKSVRPVVVSAANGNKSKDEEGLTCVAKAFKMLSSGADVLDAVVAGVNIVELDR